MSTQTQTLFLSEADSDIVGQRRLSEGAGAKNTLDIAVAAAGGLAVKQNWLTSPLLPQSEVWAAGDYTLTLDVESNEPNLVYAIEVWKADKLGVDISQIGSQTATQTGTGIKTFIVTAASDVTAALADRLKLKLLTDETVADSTLSLRMQVSNLATPILEPPRLFGGKNRLRSDFLVRLRRRGEPEIDQDGFFEVN